MPSLDTIKNLNGKKGQEEVCGNLFESNGYVTATFLSCNKGWFRRRLEKGSLSWTQYSGLHEELPLEEVDEQFHQSLR